MPVSQTTNNVIVQQVDPIPNAISPSEQIVIAEDVPTVSEEVFLDNNQVEELNFIQIPSNVEEDQNKSKEKGSLFNRLFKRK